MGLFGQGYDPRGQERSSDFGEPLPRAVYLLEITGAEEKPTNDGTGEYLKIETTVRSKSFAGRKVWHRFNLKNKNPKAEMVARKEFCSMLDAIGMGDVIIRNPTQVVGKLFAGRVDVVPNSKGDGYDNEIRGWKPKTEFDGTAPATAAAGQAGAPAAAPAWQRRPGAAAQQQQSAQQQAQPAQQQPQEQQQGVLAGSAGAGAGEAAASNPVQAIQQPLAEQQQQPAAAAQGAAQGAGAGLKPWQVRR